MKKNLFGKTKSLSANVVQKSKYCAVKTTVDGIRFDSKAEANYYLHLKFLESKNIIKIVEIQPKRYMTEAKILYKPDFLIIENGKLIYIDVKGMITPVFAIKARLWVHYGAGTLRLVKNGKITKEIVSKNKT